ncbi:MAG: hypothetical protein M1814_006583 [Vezdaea aestivalis]|nr:MAG: hypothetical protein M1814_006583 [Vezdaea aestivalis]
MIVPTRFQAQADTVNLIFHSKTNANPESSVGLMSMGGGGPEVLVTLTTDFGKILDGIHRTKIRGGTHLATGIQIAGLALKHRQNRSQRQRIIVFVCSPITEDEKTLTTLAKKMKKNKVSIDFVVFGDLESDNTKKLEAFSQNVKGAEGSHMEVVAPGPNLLSDVLRGTPILEGEGAMNGGGTGEGGAGGDEGASAFEFGVDPSADPELAVALKMSYEEEKLRQEREKKEREEAEKDSKPNLEGIREEDEAQPLLDKKEGNDEEPKPKKEEKDDDKMDTT